MPEMIHIRAVKDRRVMLVKQDGSVRPGRFAGCTADGAMMPDGEEVLDHGHYHRSAGRGDLVIVRARVEAPPAIASLPAETTHLLADDGDPR